jgi:hypothetical protein
LVAVPRAVPQELERTRPGGDADDRRSDETKSASVPHLTS